MILPTLEKAKNYSNDYQVLNRNITALKCNTTKDHHHIWRVWRGEGSKHHKQTCSVNNLTNTSVKNISYFSVLQTLWLPWSSYINTSQFLSNRKNPGQVPPVSHDNSNILTGLSNFHRTTLNLVFFQVLNALFNFCQRYRDMERKECTVQYSVKKKE